MSEWTLLLLHCLTRLSIEASLSLSVINSILIKSLNAIKKYTWRSKKLVEILSRKFGCWTEDYTV
jgi:hypothetical protein